MHVCHMHMSYVYICGGLVMVYKDHSTDLAGLNTFHCTAHYMQ